MWYKRSLVVACFFSWLSLSLAHDAEPLVLKFLRHADIVPEVLETGPQEFLNVTYMGTINADRGVELQPMQVRDPPEVKWITGRDTYYTLIMIDPDVPTKVYPTLRSHLHWLVVNIPGNQLNMADVRASYVGAMPEEGSGVHRYIFLLYKQPDFLKFDFPKVPKHSNEGRQRFNIRDFVDRYKLGFPLAANFFSSMWSKDVPILEKTIFQSL